MPSFLENIYAEIVSWLSQASYYGGLVSGLLILAFIIIPILNRILIHLTLKHEVSTYGAISNPPPFTEGQKSSLKEALWWWNKQCDGWYISQLSCLDKALTGQKINLADIQRLSDSTQVGKYYNKKYEVSQKTQEAFDALDKSLRETEEKLIKEIEYKKLNSKIIKQVDIVSQNVTLAKYSAIAAVSSALATGLLTYFTFLNRLPPCGP